MGDRGVVRGFRWVDLIIVPAVILVLAVILYPVFRKADGRHPSNQCLNNLKQIALGVAMYAQNNGERLPAVQTTDTFPWSSQVVSYTGNSRLFDCPQTAGSGTPEAPDYGYNGVLGACYSGGKYFGAKWESDGNAAACPLLADARPGALPKNFAIYDWENQVDPRHNGGAVVAFVDGHVIWSPPKNHDTGASNFTIRPDFDPYAIGGALIYEGKEGGLSTTSGGTAFSHNWLDPPLPTGSSYGISGAISTNNPRAIADLYITLGDEKKTGLFIGFDSANLITGASDKSIIKIPKLILTGDTSLRLHAYIIAIPGAQSMLYAYITGGGQSISAAPTPATSPAANRVILRLRAKPGKKAQVMVSNLKVFRYDIPRQK